MMQAAWRDLALAEESEVRRRAARMAIMLMTVSSSMSEKALWAGLWVGLFTLCVV